MKTAVFMLIIILSYPLCAIAAETAKVIKVIDGDTITLDNNEKVRLIGIDTPERGDCYYKEATLSLRNLVLNKQVTLEKDITNRDKYNRLLRYIYINDSLINDIQVRGGYAEAYLYKPDVKYYHIFKVSEKYAKRNNLGIWKDCKISAFKHFNIIISDVIKLLS